jgi:ABC-type branched-subunit amino acid transport system substrate-binding protein
VRAAAGEDTAVPSVVVNSGKTPLIATNPKVTVQDDGSVVPYTFRVCFIDPFQGTVAAQFAAGDLKAKTAATLYDVGDEYSQFLAKYFVDAFTKAGGTMVAQEVFRSGELDFRAQLGKIKEGNPDVLFIPTMQKETALASKQARELGIKSTLMGGDGWGSPDLVDLAGNAVEGAYFVNLAALEDPAIQDFLKEYRAKYNQDPVLPNPLMAYDAMIWLADAIKRAGSTDGTKIRDAMEQTKDLQVLTGKLTVDPKTHNPLNKPAVIQQVKGGKFIEDHAERRAAALTATPGGGGGHRAGARTPPPVRQPDGARELGARRVSAPRPARHCRRRDLRFFVIPGTQTAFSAIRGHAVGRRAADARHRARSCRGRSCCCSTSRRWGWPRCWRTRSSPCAKKSAARG